MNRILGVDKAAQSISSSLPEAATKIADALPAAAKELTANAPETFTAAAKALSENLQLPDAAKALGEALVIPPLPSAPPVDKKLAWVQTAVLGVAAAGVFIAGVSYAYDVYYNHKPAASPPKE